MSLEIGRNHNCTWPCVGDTALSNIGGTCMLSLSRSWVEWWTTDASGCASPPAKTPSRDEMNFKVRQ